ncbi:MAG: DUF2125 domain-containing protein [Pseudomonadota bacterium]
MPKSPGVGALALSASLAATTVQADMTAQDVWESWQQLTAEMGQTLEAEGERETAEGLVVSGITVTMDLPEGAIFAPLGDVTFVENTDGTVSIEVPDTYPVRVTGTGSDGEAFDLNLTIRQPDLALTALGDPQSPSYSYVAPEVGFRATELTVEGEPVDIDLDVSMRALDGAYDFLGTSSADSKLAIGALAMRLSLEDPDNPGTDFAMNMTMQDIASANSGSIMPFNAARSLGVMLGEGFASTGELTYGAVTYGVDGGDSQDRFTMEGSIDGGVFSAQLGEGGIIYGGENNGIEVAVSGTQIPFPSVTFEMEQSTGSVTLPLAPSDEPTDFAFLMKMTGLTVDDRLWGLVDPGRLLPRDGADLVIDLLGTGKWLIDITDPDQTDSLDTLDGMPGELETLTVRELKLSAAGAELTGAGGFTFDSSGPFGTPQPAGSIDLSLTGANTLLERLVSMGILPEEQAMGAQMMLGLFAQPGPGPDSLTSTIEVAPDGSVSANGQRIR